MAITPKEVLAVLLEIGKSISVVSSEQKTCHTFVKLSNGWTLEIFDECQSEWDYLEAVIIDGERTDCGWNDNYSPEDNEWETVIHNHWSPTEEQLELMRLS